MNYEQLLKDYIENIESREMDKGIHVEDVMIDNPSKPGTYDTVYSLFKVTYVGGGEGLYIGIQSETANTLIRAKKDLLEEYFPDHLPKQEEEKI